jgi:hypothetical protein
LITADLRKLIILQTDQSSSYFLIDFDLNLPWLIHC